MLPLLTVGFLVGLLLGSYALFMPITTIVLCSLAAVGIVIGEAKGLLTRPAGHGLYVAGLIGMLWWFVMGPHSIGADPAVFAKGETSRLEGTVREPVRQFPGRAMMVLVDCLATTDEGRTVAINRVRVTWREADAAFLPGDRVAVRGKLRAPWGFKNPGGFDYGSYLEHKGIEAILSVTGAGRVTLVTTPSPLSWWTPWRVIERWREQLRIAAVRSLNESSAGIYLGMILGQNGFVSPETRDTYMATGTVHILSISGSHLGLIALLSFWMTKAACSRLPSAWFLTLTRWITPTRLAAVVTAVPVTFYTLLAGYEVATVRSWLMIMLFLWAVWLGRPNPVLVTLCSAALAVLIHDPEALYDISFQLSFLSVLAIGLALSLVAQEPGIPPLDGWSLGHRLRTWTREYLWITGGVTMATVPLVAYYFNQVAWLGLLANLLIVPFAGFVLVPVGLASAIWGLATGAKTLPAAALNDMLCDGFSTLVAWFARVPGAEWHVASPSVPLMLVYYLVLAMLLCRGRELRFPMNVGLAWLLVCLLAWWVWSPRWALDPTSVRVTFLDVGQGDATVVELPDGGTIVIDGGAAYDSLDLGRAVVGPYLWDRGIRRVDHLIGTHPQLDHVGGLATLVEKFSVGQYWGNGLGREEHFHHRLREALTRRQVPELRAEEGRIIIESPSCRLLALNPPSPDRIRTTSGETSREDVRLDGAVLNNRSVVTRLTCGSHSFLFAADVEGTAMQRMLDQGAALDSEVLKVPHHGARSSLHEGWIAQVHPKEAVISVGRQNAYGHPVPDVLDTYREEGGRLWLTSESGAVWIAAGVHGHDLDVQTARSRELCAVPLGPTMWGEERLNLARTWHRWIES